MEIRTTYKFEYEKDGKILKGISAGFLPDYAINVLETINILYADKGMDLKRIADGIISRYFKFLDGDSLENYEEIESEEKELRPERLRKNVK